MLRERTMMRPRYASRRTQHRRWSGVSWWFSLLFVVPLVLLAGTMLTRAMGNEPSVALTVTDRFSGAALAGAEVVAGERTLVSDDNGAVKLTLPSAPILLSVKHRDYEPMFGQLDAESDPRQDVALRPTTVEGTILDETNGQPIVGATVSAGTGTEPRASTAKTDANGAYRLTNVPANASLRVEAGDYGMTEEAIGERRRIDAKMRISIVTGQVTDEAGEPIAGVVVRSGNAQTETDEEGAYRLTNVAEGDEVIASLAGYEDARVGVTAERKVSLQLKRNLIKAVYLPGTSAGVSETVDELIELIDSTELNAVVLDIKEGIVFYDTRVEFFRDAGTVEPTFDAAELLKKFQDRDIYVIARLVVFNDSLVAEARQDLAVKDVAGEVWRDANGAAWVDPFKEELWTANIDLALEAAELGFDEIQYDYIRFPSDGDLSTAEFSGEYSEASRVGTIASFLEASKAILEPTGVKTAVDLFGYIAFVNDDQGIGQNMETIAPLVDYMCPMIYPSHFTPDSIDVGGEPNNFPGDVIAIALDLSKAKVPGMELKIRPWLQDFDIGAEGMRDYETEDIVAQIDATEDAGASGWMLWNPGATYHNDAFEEVTS